MGDQRVDLAEAAQHGGDEQPGEGAVACRQRRHVDIVLDRVVERTFPPKNGTDQIDGDAAGRRGERHTGANVLLGRRAYCETAPARQPVLSRMGRDARSPLAPPEGYRPPGGAPTGGHTGLWRSPPRLANPNRDVIWKT
jgi:hypothetical protein